MSHRVDDIIRFYSLLDRLKERCAGTRLLATCSARMNWPYRGVYFFFETGEVRSDSGHALRVVRVGTHAVSSRSRSTLWGRLSQHRGSANRGDGNHRGSIFRLLIGEAIAGRERSFMVSSWGHDVVRPISAAERQLEGLVSEHIRNMPFLWMEVEDEPSSVSLRAYVERNSIALLSNARGGADTLDRPSNTWLGWSSPRETIRHSGLWNQRHIREQPDPGFLEVFERLL
jgi:hypothetical protein